MIFSSNIIIYNNIERNLYRQNKKVLWVKAVSKKISLAKLYRWQEINKIVNYKIKNTSNKKKYNLI
jgi:hypothetical protein